MVFRYAKDRIIFSRNIHKEMNLVVVEFHFTRNGSHASDAQVFTWIKLNAN